VQLSFSLSTFVTVVKYCMFYHIMCCLSCAFHHILPFSYPYLLGLSFYSDTIQLFSLYLSDLDLSITVQSAVQHICCWMVANHDWISSLWTQLSASHFLKFLTNTSNSPTKCQLSLNSSTLILMKFVLFIFILISKWAAQVQTSVVHCKL